MNPQNFEIDLVYLWVDGNDPEWIKKKEAVTGQLNDNSEADCRGRYANNDELKYSLRSVEKHAPWIRKIYIVTDNQVPEWLDTSHPKIKIIDHKEILPLECLPCFNAVIIEHYIYKITGLSEYFLLANDDMFFNNNLKPEYFFEKDGYPIIRQKKKIFGEWDLKLKKLMGLKPGQYRQMLIQAAHIVEKKFGKSYISIPHHNIDSYRKTDYQKAVEVIFKEQVERNVRNHIRTADDLNRAAFAYYSLAIGHGHLRYVNRKLSSRLLLYRHNMQSYLKKYNPDLFCVNDNQRVTDAHRTLIKPFLDSIFPDMCAFEK